MTRKRLLIGTTNPGKLREYRQILADLPFDLVGLAELGLDTMEVEESGATFEENAALKAAAYARASGLMAFADDSGLAVDALNGAPGVFSARYGPDEASRRKRLLKELQGVGDENRTARFVCVISLADPISGDIRSVMGTCEGRILHEERDSGYGFGYDPLFCPQGYEKTFSELPSEVKNQISHRGAASKKLYLLLSEMP